MGKSPIPEYRDGTYSNILTPTRTLHFERQYRWLNGHKTTVKYAFGFAVKHIIVCVTLRYNRTHP